MAKLTDNQEVIVTVVDWLKNLAPLSTLKLVADSREVQSGDVFFAYSVGAGDGRKHIPQAIAQGARAVVYEEQNFSWNLDWNVPHLAVSNLLWQSGFIASSYLNQPDASFFNVAVTGTNGKTSCTQWLARTMSMLGTPAGVIGTLGVGIAKNGLIGELDATGFTTPDALQLQQKIMTQRDLGIQALAIEASSIGLHQGRMNGMHVDVAVFTNFTRDHLDFHGDMVNYQASKAKLFEWPNLKTAVVNLDDMVGVKLAQLCKQRGVAVIGFTVAETNNWTADTMPTLTASGLRNDDGGVSFHLASPFGEGFIKTQLIGRFNVSNVLAVLAVLFSKGVTWQQAVQAVERLTSVAGRMEQLSAPGRVLVIIDYAHTPDALEKALTNLKEVAKERNGKLWCVFGCGGNRDPGKRAAMGKVAELADEIIVTSDNPRNEEPSDIINQIVDGFTTNRYPAPVIEADRAKAILYAIKRAEKNDVVLLAGKGHEAYQEIKGNRLPFSDSDHAYIALADIATRVGL